MAKRGRKPKKVEEVEVKEKKVKKEKEVKLEKIKENKVKEDKIEIQEELFKNDDFEVDDSDSFEEYDDEELEDEVDDSKEKEEMDEEVIVNKGEVNELKNIKLISIVSLCVSVVTLILTLVILNKVSGNSTYKSENKNGTDSSEEVVGYDVSKFESITAGDFIDMFEADDETYFVYTGRSTCGYCVQFVPVLNQSIEEYDYTVHYLDVSTVSDSDYETIIGLDDELEENFGYTPMVFVVHDGEVVDVNEGYSEYEAYQSFLEENDIEKK